MERRPTADIVDRDDVRRLVQEFYRDVAMDDLLGAVFAAGHTDWSAHIEAMTEFWSWQLLGHRGYAGRPLRAHEAANRRTPFTPEHYERWLALFTASLDSLFQGPVTELAKARANKVAAAMRRLLEGPETTSPQLSAVP